jgi:hypothetical protein
VFSNQFFAYQFVDPLDHYYLLMCVLVHDNLAILL